MTIGQVVMKADAAGRSKNVAESACWYLIAALRGDVKSQGAVGAFCFFGIGVQRDYERAALWMETAVKNGAIPSQTRSLTARFGAIRKSLADARGSDQSHAA
jgi:TPR repeat protein